MSRDNWEKLVGAVLRRENDRRLAYCESFSSSSSAGLSSRFSFVRDVHESAAEVSIFFSRYVKAMEYTEIRKATGNFGADSMLGGEPLMSRSRVYKGWIDKNYAAVKPGSGIAVTVELTDSRRHFDYWNKKIELSQHRHLNLVTPIGYYFDTNTRIFVNEFMAGGSLDHHLFSAQKPLSWATRIGVAVGAARGLAFLHNLEVPITYQVLMSNRILLDADFNAKLSGFGIAKDVFEYSLAIEGPRGLVNPIKDEYVPYAAPEFVYVEAGGGPSTKCDVYSFGVVLLELISGHRARRQPEEWQNLIMDLGNKRRLSRIMDSKLEGQYPPKEAYKVANIALQCVSSHPILRPSMADVVAELENL